MRLNSKSFAARASSSVSSTVTSAVAASGVATGSAASCTLSFSSRYFSALKCVSCFSRACCVIASSSALCAILFASCVTQEFMDATCRYPFFRRDFELCSLCTPRLMVASSSIAFAFVLLPVLTSCVTDAAKTMNQATPRTYPTNRVTRNKTHVTRSETQRTTRQR